MGAGGRGEWAERAARAYAAMEERFGAPEGGYVRDGLLHRRSARAHLWPFARALAATLDLTGAGASSTGWDADAAIGRLLVQLERYWDASGEPPGYASDVAGERGHRDLYHDDNAWVGLALVQLARMRDAGRVCNARHGSVGGLVDTGGRHGARDDVIAQAGQLYALALAGWDDRSDGPAPGGIFWVRQGHGIGRRNHDRNTVSTAPNAQLGLHLRELGAAPAPAPVGPRAMYEWVNAALDESRGTDAPGTGPFVDKIRGSGKIDARVWTYNQGNMVGLNMLLARAGSPGRSTEDSAGRDIGDPGAASVFLARADAIARRALAEFDARKLDRQPPAFNAILFRNLLQLSAATTDAALRTEITSELRGAADRLWRRRNRSDLVGRPRRRPTLLDQSALVSMLALAAWDPADYALLA